MNRIEAIERIMAYRREDVRELDINGREIYWPDFFAGRIHESDSEYVATCDTVDDFLAAGWIRDHHKNGVHELWRGRKCLYVTDCGDERICYPD